MISAPSSSVVVMRVFFNKFKGGTFDYFTGDGGELVFMEAAFSFIELWNPPS
jgi:hypothetical protein